MQGKELNKRFSTEVQWLGLSTVMKMVSFQWNDQRHVEYVKINRYRQLALDGVVDTHMDFISSDAGSSPTNGGPQLSRQNQKPRGKNKIPHSKTKATSLLLWSIWFCREVFRFCRFLPWGFWFCHDVFVFAVRFLVLPWGILFLPWRFWFCRDSCGPPYPTYYG